MLVAWRQMPLEEFLRDIGLLNSHDDDELQIASLDEGLWDSSALSESGAATSETGAVSAPIFSSPGEVPLLPHCGQAPPPKRQNLGRAADCMHGGHTQPCTSCLAAPEPSHFAEWELVGDPGTSRPSRSDQNLVGPNPAQRGGPLGVTEVLISLAFSRKA